MFKRNNTIGEIMEKCEKAEEIFLGFGMHCLYCPMSQAETLEEACAVHDIDVELLLEKLNNACK